MRNDKGQFIRGHEVITSRDKTTGRFVKKPMDQLSVEEQVDLFLVERENKDGSD